MVDIYAGVVGDARRKLAQRDLVVHGSIRMARTTVTRHRSGHEACPLPEAPAAVRQSMVVVSPAASSRRNQAASRREDQVQGVIAEGGCFCGAVRYRGVLLSSRVHGCHCSDCRRVSGAPFLAWTDFDPDQFEFTTGSPGTYAALNDAGARTLRHFCKDCGTQMTYRRPDEVEAVWVTIGSLDEPGELTPGEHIWTGSRLDWVLLDDRWPQHEGGFPGD